MTNAILWELLPSDKYEEKKVTLAYVRQIHYFQGFQYIFIPNNVFSSLNSVVEANDKFIKELPLIEKNEKRLLDNFKENINTLLWSTKKTDVSETGLTSFLASLAIWVQAKKLRSAIFLHFSNPTGNFSRLIHMLAEEQSKFVEFMIDDVESWFFSHFADFLVDWPYFSNFSSYTIGMLEDDSVFLEYQRSFVDSREKLIKASYEKTNLNEYTKMLSKLIADQKVLFNHISKNYHEYFFTTKASLAPSKENWEALRHLVWKCDSFDKLFKSVKIHNRNFIPYFVRFDLHPFELLEKINSNSLRSERTTDFNSAYYFESILKAEMEFALNNFKKGKCSNT